MKKIITIVGTTASGKTSLAIRLSHILDAEVISLDSRQIFKRMPIGTAQPTNKEKDGVTHHLIGFKNPWDPVSAGRYAELVLDKVSNIHKNGKIPIICGGAGLYFRAIKNGLFSKSSTDESLTNFIDSVIINAGDGTHEHPTQAILDMMSLQEKFGKLKGLKVAIVGDILHSRVALSNIHGLKTMGAEVILCGPPNLVPDHLKELEVTYSKDVDEVIEWADALNVLRIQRERMGRGLVPSTREYRSFFGITSERIKKHKKEIVIMHPGPMNRGVEIDGEVADSDQAIILDQVLNGVASRMAILYLLCGGRKVEGV